MSALLSIDPGLRACGSSLFLDGKLIAAAYVQNSAEKGGGPLEARMMAREVLCWAEKYVRLGASAQLAVELPQTYGGRAEKGDANTLIGVGLIDGALSGMFPSDNIVHYRPHDWKGSIRKPLNQSGEHEYVITTRVKARLSEDERKCVDWTRSVKHSWDVADSLGVGLTFLGRFAPVRKFARE